ncbi:MAG: hypothetical protein HRU75_02865 [Planctomycetia bacterium]|nr:MAG: hypothetical protein HRU75_02865 [Planctomycetia bacterium]
MRLQPADTWLLLTLVALALSGCAGRPPTEGYLSRAIDADDEGVVLASASRIVARELGSASINRARGEIRSSPAEMTATRETGAPRELVGGASTLRRTCSLLVHRSGSSVIARVRVDVERRDTQRGQVQSSVMGMHEGRLGDAPTTEPSWEAGPRGEIWTRVGRDAAMERVILEALRNEFAPTPATQP